ncbi:hypothetical protein FACS1894214_0020 [Planctomycetales bacterium]|nr:hypothetical protein FACS1894214_0020 [Planctomycetales bacterium]
MSIGELLIPESFAALPINEVNGNEVVFSNLWESASPNIDVKRGALNALVVRPFSTLMAAGQQAFEDGRQQSSLTYLLSNNSDRISSLLDEMALNYRITRRAGTPANGRLRLVFRKPMSLAIGSGVHFDANGIDFSANDIYTASAIPALSNTSSAFEQIYKPMPDNSGYVYIDISVSANSPGSAGNLVRGTEVEVLDQPFLYFIRAYALETFTGGSDSESDDELINRMRYGISAKVLSSRINMKAALLETFPDIRDSSIIGAGDIEMVRDKMSVFPISIGGYADWYIASTRQLETITVITDKFEVVNTDNPDFPVYKMELNDSDISCIYYISNLAHSENDIPLEIIERRRWYDSESEVNIVNPEEAFFSAYQITEIRFIGPEDLQGVKVSALHMPLIKDIQDWVLQCGQAPIGTDILVRGAIPTKVLFSAELTVPTGSDVDFTLLKTIVSDYINVLPINGTLAVSRLVALLQNNLPAGSFISSPALFAVSYLPDGPSDMYSTNDILVLPWQQYTNRTSVFYSDPNDISFSRQFITERC